MSNKPQVPMSNKPQVPMSNKPQVPMSNKLEILSFKEAINLPMIDDYPPSWGPAEPHSVTYAAIIKAMELEEQSKQKKEITKAMELEEQSKQKKEITKKILLS